MNFTEATPRPIATLINDGGGQGMEIVQLWAAFRPKIGKGGSDNPAVDVPAGLQLSVVFLRPDGAMAHTNQPKPGNSVCVGIAVLLDDNLKIDRDTKNWTAQRQIRPYPGLQENWGPYNDSYNPSPGDTNCPPLRDN
jgi:hypothetical protein